MDMDLASFSSLSLEDLNARAGLLERTDRKYVVGQDVLEAILPALERTFDVLDIDGQRRFAYESVYFDDDALSCYKHHHQGRRIRFKVRTRRYVDMGNCFVELKLKGARGKTLKRRFEYPADASGSLDAEAWDKVCATYSEVYGRAFDFDLGPALQVCYERTTLVAKQGAERITIDRNIVFSDGDARVHRVDRSIAIVETKSATGNGIADRLLRNRRQHPVSRCSKYCLGLIALRKVTKFNNFRPAARLLKLGTTQGVPSVAVVVAAASYQSRPISDLAFDTG